MNPSELPEDPDWSDVPDDLRRIAAIGVEDPAPLATLLLVPDLFGHARRLREGFYGEDGAA